MMAEISLNDNVKKEGEKEQFKMSDLQKKSTKAK